DAARAAYERAAGVQTELPAMAAAFGPRTTPLGTQAAGPTQTAQVMPMRAAMTPGQPTMHAAVMPMQGHPVPAVAPAPGSTAPGGIFAGLPPGQQPTGS